MMLLTVDEIIAIHSKLTERTGGSDGLRDIALLESAVYGAESSFGGKEAYPSIYEKAARLMYALTSNHAFIDGNKRIGVLVMLMTLRLNNIQLSYTQDELVAVVMLAADGSIGYDEILVWIKEHKV